MTDIKFTKYEKTQIIGARAKALSMGAKPLLELEKDQLLSINYNPVQIAIKEFEAGVLPITVERPLPTKKEDA